MALSLTVTAQVDILNYIEQLSEVDREKLNEMASRYNIHNYVRLLRGAKKDRDKQLESLRRQQQVRSNFDKDGNDQLYDAKLLDGIFFKKKKTYIYDSIVVDPQSVEEVEVMEGDVILRILPSAHHLIGMSITRFRYSQRYENED